MIKRYLIGKRLAKEVILYSVVCIYMLLHTSVAAQNIVTPSIRINNVAVNNALTPAAWLADNTHSAKLPLQVLLQFHSLPSASAKAQLKDNGISLLDYIPGNVYTAIVHKIPTASVFQSSGISLIADMQPEWKISDELKQTLPLQDDFADVTVLFTGDYNRADIDAQFYKLGAEIISERISMGYCHIKIPADKVLQLAQWHHVSYMSSYRQDVPLNTYAKAMTRMHIAAANTTVGGYGLKGEGVAIGIGDNTSGVYHVDLADRIINYNPQAYTNHGVHINGIAGGAGIVDPKGEGMAPAATLTNHFFSDVLEATPFIASQHNVVATNNSYSASSGSCAYSGTYDGLSAGLDNLCNDYKNVFQVFAAANDGLFDCPPYPKGFATIAGGYQAAKNIIVVASTDKEYVNADNSSRGPLRDGRLKPEITAVGVDVISDTKNDEYLVASGTSMACPQVAGAAALLTERIRQLGGSLTPRSDVLKTLMINGATDIGIPGPDFRFGFGFLNVERSLIMLDSNRYFTNTVNNGAQVTHNINVPPGTGQLKVTLCWHDVPASPLATTQLVNDLDLVVSEPGGALHNPLVLDPSPANINNPAVEKKDRLNNTEQVVIQNPAAGIYTAMVNGYSLPSGSRDYVLAYDFLPQGIHVKYPLANSAVKAADSLYIYWDAVSSNGTFSLEYSINNGTTWIGIDNNIAADKRHYKWMVPGGINSGRCLIRLSRASEQSVSGLFVINEQPVVKMAAIQCPGYISIEWGAVPNATAYHVMRKNGPALIAVDTVTDTTYVFPGLALDSTYYVTVAPVIDGLQGYRAIAKKRKPSDGNCNGNISDGDLMIGALESPATGRMFTETELTGNELLRVAVRNLDDVANSSYTLSYSINGAAWVTQNFSDPLPANNVKTISLPGIDLSAVGDYEIRMAVTNTSSADNMPQNDSAVFYISQLPNAPITLDYTDDFESLLSFNVEKDTFGFSKGRRWDFKSTTDTGRIRSLVLQDVTISGQRSLSLDASRHCKGNINILTGTFNLAAYDKEREEVRMEFDYIIHNVPKSSDNELSVKGSNGKLFRVLYPYDIRRVNVGRVLNSGSLSLSDAMADAGDNFSAATQLQFKQNDVSLVGGKYVGNGMTIDNVRLYTVQNDVQLLQVVSPSFLECGVTGPVPLTVTIRNGVSQVQNNVKISYRLDNGDVVTENIASLSGKEKRDYTFSKLLDITRSGSHNINVWVDADGDTYHKNDSIINYSVRNQPLVAAFPYIEDFEQDNGFWYTDGTRSSWAYGTPSAPKINKAASGQKAWVTNLSGNYNPDEISYLYTPCFDLTGMDKPVVSFKMALDIENCNDILCDAAYMDYSLDGVKWERLGKPGEGINWYNDSVYYSWTLEDKTAWHQAELPLPLLTGNVQFRFGLHTDPGSEKEGIGIDDFRIFNRVFFVPDNNIISISPNPATDGLVNIEWAAVAGTEMKVVVTDMTGRDIYRQDEVAQEGYNKTTLNTPAVSTGMYFIRITIGDKEHLRKIIFRRS